MEGAETVRFFSRNADGFRALLSDRERNGLAPVPLSSALESIAVPCRDDAIRSTILSTRFGCTAALFVTRPTSPCEGVVNNEVTTRPR